MGGPDRHGSEPPESVEFQLPVDGLYADLELGRGSVRLSDEFAACSSALQIEVIDGWLRALRQCRMQALQQLYRQLATADADAGDAETLSRFRTTCHTLGIDVPADFVAPER